MTMRATTASTGLMAAVLLAGCRQDMHNQPKFYPQRGTTFYADGRSVRPQVENTVARGQLDETDYFYTGMKDGKEGDALPFPATIDVLARGQERYNIYCTPCHSRVGNGVGMIVQRGYAKAGNFHTARLEAAPLGHFFNVITNGYGAMPDYSAQVTPADRWAIVAYIKALQLSQNAQQSDIAAGQHVQPLTDIATQEGFPANFAAEWTLPPTAVEGTPTGDTFVLQPGEIGKASANIGKPGYNGSTKAQDSTGYPPPAYNPTDPNGVRASHPE
jgi:mono/diheme cytochrome c family protein